VAAPETIDPIPSPNPNVPPTTPSPSRILPKGLFICILSFWPSGSIARPETSSVLYFLSRSRTHERLSELRSSCGLNDELMTVRKRLHALPGKFTMLAKCGILEVTIPRVGIVRGTPSHVRVEKSAVRIQVRRLKGTSHLPSHFIHCGHIRSHRNSFGCQARNSLAERRSTGPTGRGLLAFPHQPDTAERAVRDACTTSPTSSSSHHRSHRQRVGLSRGYLTTRGGHA
jgi:hypothetical protein